MKVLSGLTPPPEDARLLVDTSTWDDAGVARFGDGMQAIVQSVDFFPPVVDDPWWFGRIAAANALSDLYAMGAEPFSALNVVAFPSKDLPLDLLTAILEGASDAFREAGVLLLGGHSVTDTGVKYGAAVTGFVEVGKQVTNAGAQIGDLLYLTKTLGTGCVTTAAKKNRADEELLKRACEQMGTLNKGAAHAMVSCSVHGATDVTGFGLAGHSAELGLASGADIRLNTAAIPQLEGAYALMEDGMASGGVTTNREYLGDRLLIDAEVDPVLVNLVCDSETSGGLLVAVDVDGATNFELALKEQGVLVAPIGQVVEGEGRVHLVTE